MSFNVSNSLPQKLLDIAQIREGNTVLDVGCGTGTLAILIKLKFPKTSVFGLDPNNEALTIARDEAQQENAEVRFIQGVAEKIPYKVNTFDVVVSSLTFHHLSNTSKKQAIGEIYRVLKPAGTLYLIDVGKPKNIFWKLFTLMAERLEPQAYIKDNVKGHIPADLREAGFTLSEARQPFWGIYFWKARKNSFGDR